MPQFELIGSSIARICYLQKLLHNLPPFGNTSADIDNEDCFDLDCHLMELSTQQALLHNAIVLILAEVIDEDDLMELLKHPTGHDWKSPLIENKARVVLGQNYEKFFDRMSQLHVHLNVICEVFNVHTQVSVDDWALRRSLKSELISTQRADVSNFNIENIVTVLRDLNDKLYVIADGLRAAT